MGNFLYRYRGVVGFIAFVVVYLMAHPEYKSILLSIPLIVIGLVIRSWAIGYIGRHSRSKEICARIYITAGPYRFIKHPLYIGNFFLVLGVLIAMSAQFIISAIVLLLFGLEYFLISKSEEKYLHNKFMNKDNTQYCNEGTLQQKFKWKNVLIEFNTIVTIIFIYGFIIIKIHWWELLKIK
ncbi:MAG: hypothetical protein N2201_02355 [candidate division WOR-3 bacterium]|nr:hypothetical protein [candidate division WOR-3 bacterium]